MSNQRDTTLKQDNPVLTIAEMVQNPDPNIRLLGTIFGVSMGAVLLYFGLKGLNSLLESERV